MSRPFKVLLHEVLHSLYFWKDSWCAMAGEFVMRMKKVKGEVLVEKSRVSLIQGDKKCTGVNASFKVGANDFRE